MDDQGAGGDDRRVGPLAQRDRFADLEVVVVGVQHGFDGAATSYDTLLGASGEPALENSVHHRYGRLNRRPRS